MKHGHSLFLISVGSLALFLCSVAARADSIPTLTATSVSLSDHFAFSWSIAGDSFSLGGSGLPDVTLGTAVPGQSLAEADFANGPGRVYFAGQRGNYDDSTYGTVTLGGITHSVVLLGTAYISFPTATIYTPAVLPPPPDSHAVTGRMFSGPATVLGQSISNNTPSLGLQEMFCDPRFTNSQSCYGNVIADLSIDVPGIATLTGVNYAGDPYDSITSIEFTSTPEPVSYGLTAAGLVALLWFTAFRRRPRSCVMGK